MDDVQYLKIIDGLESSHQTLMCEYCGAETPSIGELCICSNCECVAHSTRPMLEKRDHLLLDALDSINSSIASQNYDAALATYDKLVAERKEPPYMYAQALLYLKYSNYEIGKINYSRQGFMEENTTHRNNAAKSASASKRLIAKAISVAENETATGNTSPNIVYMLFLAQMKLGNHRAAQISMNQLFKIGNRYLADYSAMVFSTHMQDYAGAIKSAERLLINDNFSVNALFYIGYSKFRGGKVKEAGNMLARLGSLIVSENLHALLQEMSEQFST
jgi:tetratricopeptide (TPR) repeat protein